MNPTPSPHQPSQAPLSANVDSPVSASLEKWLEIKARIQELSKESEESGKPASREAINLASRGIKLLTPHIEALPSELVVALNFRGSLYASRERFKDAANFEAVSETRISARGDEGQ